MTAPDDDCTGLQSATRMQQCKGFNALTAGLLMLMQACMSEGLRLAVIPDPEEPSRHQSSHELPAFASGLRNLGHEVSLLEAAKDSSTALEALLGSGISPEDAYYDVILTQGAYISLNDRCAFMNYFMLLLQPDRIVCQVIPFCCHQDKQGRK